MSNRIFRRFRFALLGAGISLAAAGAEATSTAVDQAFASNFPGRSAATYSRRVWPLTDGGAMVEMIQRPSFFSYIHYFRVRPDGRLASTTPVWTAAFAPPYDSQSVAAVLGDGSFVMATAPYRRDAGGQVIESFVPPPELFDRSLTAAVQQPDGKLLLAAGARLVRLQETGAADASFNASASGASAIVGLHVDGEGRIVVVDAPTSAPYRSFRLLPGGAIDPAFQPITTAAAPIAVTARGEPIGRRGFPRHRPDGSLDEGWDVRPWAAGADAVAVAPSGDLYVGYSGVGVFRIGREAPAAMDPNFHARADAGATIESMAVGADGKLLVLGAFQAWEGFATSELVRLDPQRTLSIVAPRVSVESPRLTLRAGERVVVQGRAVGTGPLAFTWSALDGGLLPADIHSPQLVFPSLERANLGLYQLQVSGPGGTTTATLEVRPSVPSRLVNLSGRGPVGVGADALIAGLVLDGPVPGSPEYQLVLRGVGPGLARFDVPNPLPDPQLTWYDSFGGVIDRNDDWIDSSFTRNWTTNAGAFELAGGSRDSLIVATARGGAYTLALRDAAERPGSGLIEVFDVDRDDPLKDPRRGTLANLSLRGRVGGGADPLIAGWVIRDPTGLGRSMTVIVRVVGPALSSFGVTEPLADPRLAVFDGASREIATNDNWSSATNAGDVAAATARAGAFALGAGSRDSALLLDLPPGAYTVQAGTTDGSAGLVLVEIYRVP